MSVIVSLFKRLVKGSELTAAEHDNNMTLIEEGFNNSAAADHTHGTSGVTGLDDALAAKVNTDAVGAVNGVASLDAAGKVPNAQITGVLSTEHINNLNTALGNKVSTSSVGSADGVASLDSGGKVPNEQIAGVLNVSDIVGISTITGFNYTEGTLAAGVKVFSVAGFVATQEVFAFHQTASGTPGFLRCTAKEDGGFTITSDNAADTSDIGVFILTVS